MIQFLVPIGILGTKLLVNDSVAEGITDGISKAKFEVERKITQALVATFLNISINIILLVLAIYILPMLSDKDAVIYTICSVYFGSIIYGVYRVIENLPLMFKFIFEYKLNLEGYIYDEIYKEVRKKAGCKINNMNFISRALNDMFGRSASSIAYSISRSTTNIVIKKVTSVAVILAIIFFVYVVVFRVMVAPVLIESTTELNVFQAALYPLLYTVDYFFNVNILSWLI